MSRSLSLYNNDLTSLPAGVFDALTALRELKLYYNYLTSLETGVFDALTALRYVGEGESARVGTCGDVCCRHTCARALPRISGMDMYTYGSMCVGGGHERGRPRPDGVMIVCPGISTWTTTTWPRCRRVSSTP